MDLKSLSLCLKELWFGILLLPRAQGILLDDRVPSPPSPAVGWPNSWSISLLWFIIRGGVQAGIPDDEKKVGNNEL